MVYSGIVPLINLLGETHANFYNQDNPERIRVVRSHGGLSMNSIPKCFYNDEIKELISDNVADGFHSYSSLNALAKQKLAAACIRALGNDAYGAIIDSELFTQTLKHFREYLINGKSDDLHDMASMMTESAIEYFTDNLDDMFYDTVSDQASDCYESLGYAHNTRADNGETYWVRRG